MTRRAPLTSEGGWFHVIVKTWPDTAAALTKPWPMSAITTDLTWWADKFTPDRPSFASLSERWGVSKATARRVALTFDGAENVRSDRKVGIAWETTGNRLGTAWEPVASAQTPDTLASGTAWEPTGNRLGTDWETVAPENNGNPPAFEAPQTTDSEADDRPSVETTPSEETVVPQGPLLAAPPALGPADPATDEPDWDALFAVIPLTYGEDEDEAAEDEGPVGSPAGSTGVASHYPAIEGGGVAPEADAVPRAVDEVVRGDGQARPGSLLTLEASATQPPPATRKRKGARPAPVGDVETLWEAWRQHGTVRGEPNPRRRRYLAAALAEYPLADLVDLLDAAHTGDGGYWRHLQGATERNQTAYLSPETLVNRDLPMRMDQLRAWVAAGRPRHDVSEARVEVKAEVAAKSLAQRARDAWNNVVIPNQGANEERFSAVLAAFGTSPRADEARRAILGGLTATRGLRAVGAADQWRKPALRADFMRGFAAALGGTVTEAELREVG